MDSVASIDRRLAQLGFFGLTGATGVLGVVGVIVAALTFTTGGHETVHDQLGHAALSGLEAVDTSFGSMVVEHLEILDGLTDEQLGGMSHGIAGLVATDSAQVSVAVLLANRSTRPVAVDPGDYALFVNESADPIPPSSSTIRPLTLAPGSSVNVTVTFVVPLTGAEISMGYADPDGSVIVVPVGRLDQAPLDNSNDDHTTAGDDGH